MCRFLPAILLLAGLCVPAQPAAEPDRSKLLIASQRPDYKRAGA